MKPLLHSLTALQIDGAVRAGAGSYVFHGPRSMGKATAARYLAKRLNCRGDSDGRCVACRQFDAGSYPDFMVLQPEDRPSITIEQVRNLGSSLALSPYTAGSTRLVLIDEAHQLTIEAQNALLKLIEDPPSATRFVLAAEQLEALLPTVRSRLISIHFAPVAEADIAQLLVDRHGATSAAAGTLASQADGAPGLAVRLLHDEAAVAERAELEDAARVAVTAPLFDRLVLARQLAERKANLTLFVSGLHRRLLAELRDGTATATRTASRLAALDQFRRGLEANLSPRVAIERLMLEL